MSWNELENADRRTEVRASSTVLLLGLIGFGLGGAILAFGALLIGMSFLARTNGGIHSDWTLVVLFGTLACFGLGGVAGAKGAVRLAKSRSNGKT